MPTSAFRNAWIPTNAHRNEPRMADCQLRTAAGVALAKGGRHPLVKASVLAVGPPGGTLFTGRSGPIHRSAANSCKDLLILALSCSTRAFSCSVSLSAVRFMPFGSILKSFVSGG